MVPATPDGWLPTGDIGELDDEGYLTITGRKKEMIITAGGKSVAPAPLENWLRSHPLVSQAMVLGDGRPYVSVLLTLDPDGLTHWRQMNGKHPVPVELLMDDPDLHAVLQRAIDEANKLVSRPESIRRFAILPTDFSEHMRPPHPLDETPPRGGPGGLRRPGGGAVPALGPHLMRPGKLPVVTGVERGRRAGHLVALPP